jgi:hypothetical protein
VLVAALLFGIAYVALGSPAEPQRRSRARPAAPPTRNAAVFSHRTAAHGRSCGACHAFPSSNWKTVRATDAFPDVTEYPTHGSCLECHREQFFARERPAPRICSICHVAVTPRFTARLPFPNPSGPFLASERGRDFAPEFQISFPHEPHLAMTGGSCATCHETYRPQGSSADEYAVAPPASLGDGFWLKKGTFQTSPAGHDSCFTCHAADSGLKPAPSDCATCHKLASETAARGADFDAALASKMGVTDPSTLQAWRRRQWSATFRHEGGFHTEVACTTCHDVAALNTSDRRTARVPVASCGGDMGCHVTATLDGGGALNFEVERRKTDPSFRCAKCHLAFGAAPVPASHVEAIASLKAK